MRAAQGALLFCLVTALASCSDKDSHTATVRLEGIEALQILAECLTEQGWVMYSSSTCSACRAQRKAFGDAFSHITEIECNPHAPGAEADRCLKRNVRETPTWIAEREGSEVDRLEGYQLLDALAEHTGCPGVQGESRRSGQS